MFTAHAMSLCIFDTMTETIVKTLSCKKWRDITKALRGLAISRCVIVFSESQVLQHTLKTRDALSSDAMSDCFDAWFKTKKIKPRRVLRHCYQESSQEQHLYQLTAIPVKRIDRLLPTIHRQKIFSMTSLFLLWDLCRILFQHAENTLLLIIEENTQLEMRLFSKAMCIQHETLDTTQSDEKALQALILCFPKKPDRIIGFFDDSALFEKMASWVECPCQFYEESFPVFIMQKIMSDEISV